MSKLIRIKDDKATISGERYRATVLQIVERDADGSGRAFRLIRDDETVDVSSNKEAFIIVFMREESLRRNQ